MTRLYNSAPKRVFTFGCSFTDYCWATWANIIGFELNQKYNCEFYNFGKPGAGNTYISNLISQVDQVYKFTKDDLVLVCWTSITREDRWKDGRWYCGGNIYSSGDSLLSGEMTNLLADNTYFLMRDLANIKLVDSLLSSKTQYHFLSVKNVYDRELLSLTENTNLLLRINYNNILNGIKKSFYSILWKNNPSFKDEINRRRLHKFFIEGHASPEEHFFYLKKVFQYEFSKKTIDVVKKTQTKFKDLIVEFYDGVEEPTHPYDLPEDKSDRLIQEFRKLTIFESKKPSGYLIL